MTTKTAIDDGETFSGNSQLRREVRDSTPPPVFTHKDPRTLIPHQKNSAIYGSEEDVTELIELISTSGWVKPLVVTPAGTIISGHRRCKAVLALGWESLQVEVREFPDETAELEAVLLENASRLKTTEQKVREGEAWKEIEAFKAKKRKLATQNNNAARAEVENFPPLLSEKGKTRDALAHRVGLGSGRTYAKAAKVVTKIDQDTSDGYLEVALALRKLLNEQSVDAAHALLQKSPEERQAIARLINSGSAKTIKQAVKMMKQNNQAENHSPDQVILEGFGAGDWVLVNDQAQDKAYIGHKGQIEQLLPVEQQLSVKFRDSADKARFHPHELTLIVKAPPPNPFRVGEIVFIDIDRHEAVETVERRWNGYWGKVRQIGEVGSLSVDVGKESMQLFPRDVKPIDAPDSELRSLVERVLCLRRLDLDEFEQGMLDMLQRREWFSPRQLHYLKVVESFYLYGDSHKADHHQVVQFRTR